MLNNDGCMNGLHKVPLVFWYNQLKLYFDRPN